MLFVFFIGCTDDENPVPTVTVPANATYCDGDPVPVSAFTSAPAGGTFTWTNSDPTIGLAASGIGNTPAFTATNITGSPVTATISVTPTLAGCLGTPVNYTITVNPIPAANFTTNSVCEGALTSFTDLSTISSGSITNWAWLFGDPANGTSNVQNPTYNYAVAGTLAVPGSRSLHK